MFFLVRNSMANGNRKSCDGRRIKSSGSNIALLPTPVEDRGKPGGRINDQGTNPKWAPDLVTAYGHSISAKGAKIHGYLTKYLNRICVKRHALLFT
jgi:hypothetical protein